MQGCASESRAPAPAPDLTLTYQISPQRPRVGPVTVTLSIGDLSGHAVTGAAIKLEASMSHAGMVPVFAHASEVEPGRYQSTLELTMAGDWYLMVHATLPDGRRLERQFDIKGVEPVEP